MEYDIMLAGQAVGKAAVRRQGLYYEFDCRCSLSGEGMFYVSVSCGANRESLGILVPEGGLFALHTRLPVRRLGDGALRFEALPKRPERQGSFIPLSPQEPFAYLQQLEQAYLQVRNGRTGVVIPSEDQSVMLLSKK